MKKSINCSNITNSLMKVKGMKLMTKELEKKLPPFYSQEQSADPICYVKYFGIMSLGNWTWYGMEYDKEKKLFFGLVRGYEDELGYFGLKDLENCGALIERDLYFEPTKLSDIKRKKGGC